VVGAGFVDHLVGRRHAEVALGELLENRLVIRPLHAGGHGVDLRLHEPLDEPAHGLQAAVEIHRRHDRLEQIGEHRLRHGLVQRQPFAHDQEFDQAESLADPAARLAAHHHRLHPREIPFERVGKQPIEHLADHESEDCVAEKFEPLVGGEAMLGPGGVGQGRHEQARIPKFVVDPPLALRHVDRLLGELAGLAFCHAHVLVFQGKNTVAPGKMSNRLQPQLPVRTAAGWPAY